MRLVLIFVHALELYIYPINYRDLSDAGTNFAAYPELPNLSLYGSTEGWGGCLVGSSYAGIMT